MRFGLLLGMLLSLAGCGYSARILAVLPFPGKSHYIFFSSIIKSLTERGHQVVEYSPFPPKKPIPNHSHFEVHSEFEKSIDAWNYDDFKRMVTGSKYVKAVGFSLVWGMTYPLCEDVFKHENIQKLLTSNEKFDLVITESTFGQESMVVFGHRFKAPVITVQGFYSWSAMNRNAGNALSIATIPDFTSLVATDHMSYSERLLNFVSISLTLLGYYCYQIPSHDKLMRKYFKEDIPPLVDMIGNVSLYLVNAHPAIEYPHPYTPNIIPIGGITTSPERTPLPKDIQKFMDDAKEGVVYFSLGTVVPAHLLPKEILQIFLNALKRLKQKVLWKIEMDSMPGLSENIKLTKWVPQPGVLAHPNCVLFITHGGLFSQQEALYAGVPLLGIPFFGDQAYNVRLSEYHGIGVRLDFQTLTEESAILALKTILDNPKYKENAARLSRIYRDRPLSPADSAVFWVEYVLRHQGAPHLRSAAAQLSWYQLALLDVLAAVLAALLAGFIIAYLVLRKILTLVFGKKPQAKVTHKKKVN